MKITGTLGPKTNTINVHAIRLSAETSQPIEIASPHHWHCVFHRRSFQSRFGACPSDSMAALFRIRLVKTLAERGKVRSRL